MSKLHAAKRKAYRPAGRVRLALIGAGAMANTFALTISSSNAPCQISIESWLPEC